MTLFLGIVIGVCLLHLAYQGIELWSIERAINSRPTYDPIRTALRVSPAGEDHIRFEMGKIHLITDSAGPERLVHVVSNEEAEAFAVGVLELVGVHIDVEEDEDYE